LLSVFSFDSSDILVSVPCSISLFGKSSVITLMFPDTTAQ
jgi:hypothetical protein